MGKIIGYSAIAIVLFTAFFYFYPANIFEASITELGTNYNLDIALRSYMDNSTLPEVVAQPNLVSVVPTWKGTLLLIICCIGLPIMIGYRVATNAEKQTKEDLKK